MRRVAALPIAVIVGGLIAGGYAFRSAPPAFQLELVASDPAGGGDATLSPDGRSFLTSSSRAGNVDLWMVDIETGRWTRLTDDPGEDFEGRWSPDGKEVAFTSSRGGQKDVWVLDIGTRATRRLTSSGDEDEYPVWSPDGKSIVYTGGPWAGRDFFLVPAADGPARRLTRKAGRAGACAFEPQGTSLICHRYDSGRGQLVRLWLDGEEAPLTGGAAWDYKPAPSPDGQDIVFSRSVEGPSQVWLMSATTGRAWQLVRSQFDDRWPTWDQSGRKLLFHRVVDEGRGIYLLDRRTGVRKELVGADERPLQAALDGSGRRLAYAPRPTAGHGCAFAIWTARRPPRLRQEDDRRVTRAGRRTDGVWPS
jgi:TolB protein